MKNTNFKNSNAFIVLTLVMTVFTSIVTFGQGDKMLKVGEEIFKVYESPHPYSGIEKDHEAMVWSQEIVYKGASYIAVHFNKVQLSKGDFIVVKSPDNKRYWKYQDLSVKEAHGGLWSIHIYGEKAIVEIYSKNKKGDFGYSIDKIARGYSKMQMKDTEAICGADDSEEAKCYESSEPTVYDKSRAVARLMINGTGACTGWLIGSDGHIMTNNHCVGSAATANNVTIEFMAEGENCNTNCQSWFGCAGTIEATSTTLIQTDVSLDYSLLELPNNVSNTYGYLQLRSAGPALNERIYIPQHPGAWGKRISLVSDVDQGGFPIINSLSEPRCTGGSGNDVGYFADTRGGSSGSPVISYDDHLVVALHHCANCPNRGVAVNEIIDDLGSNLPPNATPDCITNTICSDFTFEICNNILSVVDVGNGVFSANLLDVDNGYAVVANLYNGWGAPVPDNVTIQGNYQINVSDANGNLLCTIPFSTGNPNCVTNNICPYFTFQICDNVLSTIGISNTVFSANLLDVDNGYSIVANLYNAWGGPISDNIPIQGNYQINVSDQSGNLLCTIPFSSNRLSNNISKNEYGLSLAPNPAGAAFKIQNLEEIQQSVLISIYDHSGRLIKEIDQEAYSNQDIHINDLSTGIYLVKISDKAGKIIFQDKLSHF